ncbi:hypothetical protein F5Y16DRAFT_249511 [Xylariaceae sp. FL0255]|nr:hypothetical protein F5Y16DRAFT_249511 [Xylariaceae sp. FL0255]
MSSTRLSFLYPHLFRATTRSFADPASTASVKISKTRYRSPHYPPKPRVATFATSMRARQAVFERHGTAVEPIPVTPEAVKFTQSDAKTELPGPASTEAQEVAQEKGSDKDVKKSSDVDASVVSETAPESTAQQEKGPKEAASSPTQATTDERIQHSGPMEAVLHMPPPGEIQHIHISKPQYVHHFDSYTLVKQLEDGGYTQDQSITVMKAVRSLLAQNLDVAQDGLVSKSDVDNETYLFRAACSELSSEVKNNRKAADEHTRQQRTHLQHEVDILTQRMSQDIMTLKDDVKGVFNDRRMNVRDEQRNMESAIQKINLKISVTLNSDSRSEIEGLRWVLIRRSVLGIIFMAVLMLSSLRYATYVKHEKQREQKEAEEKARYAEELKKSGGREDRAPPVDAAEILAAN